ATDSAGNTTTSAAVTGLRVDNTPPTVSVATPADGAYFNAAAADPATVTATSGSPDVAEVELFACSDTSENCATGTWQSLGVDSSSPYAEPWPLPGDGNRALAA